MGNNVFSEWLRKKLEEKGWSYRAFEKRSGVSYATIGNIINKPDNKTYPDTIRKIAAALEEDEATLLNMAGYDVPVIDGNTPAIDRFANLLSKFPADEQEQLLDYMQVKLEVLKKQGKISDGG